MEHLSGVTSVGVACFCKQIAITAASCQPVQVCVVLLCPIGGNPCCFDAGSTCMSLWSSFRATSWTSWSGLKCGTMWQCMCPAPPRKWALRQPSMLLHRSAQSRSHHLKFPAVVSFSSALQFPNVTSWRRHCQCMWSVSKLKSSRLHHTSCLHYCTGHIHVADELHVDQQMQGLLGVMSCQCRTDLGRHPNIDLVKGWMFHFRYGW